MPGPRVKRTQGMKDEVFLATATEPLRKHKSSDLQPEAQKQRIAKKAQAIVDKANKKGKS